MAEESPKNVAIEIVHHEHGFELLPKFVPEFQEWQRTSGTTGGMIGALISMAFFDKKESGDLLTKDMKTGARHELVNSKIWRSFLDDVFDYQLGLARGAAGETDAARFQDAQRLLAHRPGHAEFLVSSEIHGPAPEVDTQAFLMGDPKRFELLQTWRPEDPRLTFVRFAEPSASADFSSASSAKVANDLKAFLEIAGDRADLVKNSTVKGLLTSYVKIKETSGDPALSRELLMEMAEYRLDCPRQGRAQVALPEFSADGLAAILKLLQGRMNKQQCPMHAHVFAEAKARGDAEAGKASAASQGEIGVADAAGKPPEAQAGPAAGSLADAAAQPPEAGAAAGSQAGDAAEAEVQDQEKLGTKSRFSRRASGRGCALRSCGSRTRSAP
ncbi:unnamed protein product [Prorocentrum cordatum]|uniref:Uncharacterized protein n=1 Tax=Prorocentrum cordatum TaxID=2364126 RepID=A0ABN9SSP6_9DINO|nr:unnamed protein product [Polarella glacialis]